ncbi:hypothetical protein Q1695_000514 [Nippostrongylus brasiliensis]|nr:hypothetical protein Q1695_000514 [Nippostrongylus brasiliensis]
MVLLNVSAETFNQSNLEKLENNERLVMSNVSVQSYDQTSAFLYAIEGALLLIFNSFMIVRFLSSSYHRTQRDSLLIVGCLIFDTLFGLCYMSSGIYRLILLNAYEYFPAVTKWKCMSTPAILFIVITPTAGLFALVTSFDRFYCVMFPIRYIRRRIRYAFVIMFSPYIIAVAPVLIAVMGSYSYRFIEDQPATCNLANALTAGNFLMLRCIRIVTTLSCVMIYIPIFIKMYKNIRVHYALSNLTARNQKKLLRMTLTIGLITSNTILLFTVPDIILICHPEYSSNFFYLLNLNKGVINVIIFLATQRTFRRVILGKPDITQQSFKVSPKTVVGFALTKPSSPNSA